MDKQEKRWVFLNWVGNCPKCGSDVEIFTDAPDPLVCNGDEARCMDHVCGVKGLVTVADIEEAWIDWEFENE